MFAYWIGEHQQGSTISDLYESRHDKSQIAIFRDRLLVVIVLLNLLVIHNGRYYWFIVILVYQGYIRYWTSVISRWLDIGQVDCWRFYVPRQSHLNRTSLVNKEFIIWPKKNFSCGTSAGNPKRERWTHLAPSGSQAEHRIRFILPARSLSLIVKSVIDRDISIAWGIIIPCRHPGRGRGGHLGIFWVGMYCPGLQISTPF